MGEGVTQLVVVTLIRGGHGEHIGQQLQHRQSCMPSLIGGEWVEAGKLLSREALEKLLQKNSYYQKTQYTCTYVYGVGYTCKCEIRHF